MDVDAHVRGVVRVLLAARGQTRDQVADATGIGTKTLGRRMRGESGFSAAEVYALADYFDVPISVLLDGPDALFSVAGSRKGRLLAPDYGVSAIPIAA